MKMIFRRGLTLALVLLLLLTATALGEETVIEETLTEAEETGASAEAAGTETDGWHFDEKGFLTGENPGDEYFLEDEEEGRWQYASRDLAITITRFRETRKIKAGNRTVEYLVAVIHASSASPLSSIATDPTEKRPAGYKQVSPEILVENHPCVFAMCDDMYGLRLKQYKYFGVILRDGEVRATKTRNSKKSRAWPNLDTLAVYGDGSMKAFVCDELTAEEYLGQGAVHVFAFGPWLIRDGKINEDVLRKDYYYYSEARMAIGMVEPYTYVAIAVKSEPSSKYIGVHLDWLAEKLQEYGCVEALNLDGGGSACVYFNGKLLITGKSKLRSVGSLITFGLRDVPAQED